MSRHPLFDACLLALACQANASLADMPPSNPNWFEATIIGGLKGLYRSNAAERLRFMACGYVAPELTQGSPREPQVTDDSAFAAMLEHLRTILRPTTENP